MEAYLDRLKVSVSSTEGVLCRTTAPNLKALEKMREMQENLKEVTEGILYSVCPVNRWSAVISFYYE